MIKERKMEAKRDDNTPLCSVWRYSPSRNRRGTVRCLYSPAISGFQSKQLRMNKDNPVMSLLSAKGISSP